MTDQVFRKTIPYHQRKKIFIPLGIILFLILLRIMLPPLIRVGLNTYLNEFSPSLKAHVADVDLAILRGTYSLKGITAQIKEKNKEFLEIQYVTARIPWSDLFRGELVTEVLINGMDFNYTEGLIPAIQKHLDSMEKDKDKEPSPIRVAKVDLKNSTVRTDLFPSLSREDGTVLTDIEARATNVTPTEKLPRTPFSFQAKLLKSGAIKTEGEALLGGEKPVWTLDSEMRNFDLTSLNKFLKQKVPLTFTKGMLDLYAEAKSEGGLISGYVKPFIKGLDVIKSKEEFSGARHWLAEVISALGNVVMKSEDTMATRVPFTFDKTLNPDSGKSITEAIGHGFFQELDRGIENSVGLGKEETKQSQEDKP